jgi:putative methionine-R-sulfoxide reductase with GAF domain
VTDTETSSQPFAGALEALHRILNREAEADEVLRQTVAVLHDRIADYAWVQLSFVEEDELVPGPSKGRADADGTRIEVPVSYDGRRVASLGVVSTAADAFGGDETAFLERVAVLVSAHCLVGWDTGGIPWPDVR